MSEFEVNLRSTTLQSTSSVVNEQLPVIRHVLLETDFSLHLTSQAKHIINHVSTDALTTI
jgi:hypothetical protein